MGCLGSDSGRAREAARQQAQQDPRESRGSGVMLKITLLRNSIERPYKSRCGPRWVDWGICWWMERWKVMDYTAAVARAPNVMNAADAWAEWMLGVPPPALELQHYANRFVACLAVCWSSECWCWRWRWHPLNHCVRLAAEVPGYL